jgi:hypothetical protein
MMCADRLINTQQIEYELILWVARIVLHHIAGEPLGSVADLLHTVIQNCVAAGI